MHRKINYLFHESIFSIAFGWDSKGRRFTEHSVSRIWKVNGIIPLPLAYTYHQWRTFFGRGLALARAVQSIYLGLPGDNLAVHKAVASREIVVEIV